MQLNFLGLLMVGGGIVCVGLGISGNYSSLGANIKKGWQGTPTRATERTSGGHPDSTSSGSSRQVK